MCVDGLLVSVCAPEEKVRPLALQLHTVLNHDVRTENQTQVLWKSEQSVFLTAKPLLSLTSLKILSS